MRGASVVLVLAVGLVASYFLAGEDPPPPPVPERLASERPVPPPGTPVVGCGEAISESDPLAFDDDVDLVVGPLRIVGIKLYQEDWDALVADDQWMKAAATVEAGASVTLEIPPDQRDWNDLEWGGSRNRVTLQACDEERTVWIGGFTIDYGEAPREGRCADLLVWAEGRIRRVELFPDLCGR